MSRMMRMIQISHRMFEPKRSTLITETPVILMHGIMEDKDTWGPIPQLLAERARRRVFAYDARNHGETEHVADSSFRHNVQDLFQFMNYMNINDSVLVGNNMGGMTAIRAALMLPERVETAFIVDNHVKDMSKELVHLYRKDFEKVSAELRMSERKKLEYYRFPSLKDMNAEEYIYKSVWHFRCLVMLEALKEYEESPPLPLDGRYPDIVHFLYDLCSKVFTKDNIEDIKKSNQVFFPKAEYHNFEDGLFKELEPFIELISSKITPPKASK